MVTSTTTADDFFATSSATSTPVVPVADAPQISVQGNNPASVTVGSVYNDLGATITAPVADLNLGINANVDGGPTTTPDQIQIDTTTPGTHTILYTVTDSQGLTGTATRTVTVVPLQ